MNLYFKLKILRQCLYYSWWNINLVGEKVVVIIIMIQYFVYQRNLLSFQVIYLSHINNNKNNKNNNSETQDAACLKWWENK